MLRTTFVNSVKKVLALSAKQRNFIKKKVGSELIKSLYLQQLPESTRTILACSDSGSLEVLSATTYKVHDVYARPVVIEVSRDAILGADELKAMVMTPHLALLCVREVDLDRNYGRGLLPTMDIPLITRQEPHQPRRFAGTIVNTELQRLNVPPDACLTQQ